MTKKTPLEAYATIYDLVRPYAEADSNIDKLFVGVNGFFIADDDISDFQAALDVLHGHDKAIKTSFGLPAFESEVIGRIAALKRSGQPPASADLSILFKELRAVPCEKFRIFREISGVTIDSADPVDLGPFRIYRCDVHRTMLYEDGHSKDGLFDGNEEYLIRVVVTARDPNLAVEMAEERFRQFEHVMAFICGHRSQRVAVTVGSRSPTYVKNYMATEKVAMHVSKRPSASSKVLLGPEFTSADDGSDRIWAILSSASPARMENRIMLAVEWLGQARLEISLPNAILKAAISTEILFNLRREAIAPSISNQIAETMAHVVGGDVQVKLWIEKEMKRLYSLRSDITHRGTSDLQGYDIQMLMKLGSEAIMILLTAAPYKGFTNEEEFVEYLSRIKYSSPVLSNVVKDPSPSH